MLKKSQELRLRMNRESEAMILANDWQHEFIGSQLLSIANVVQVFGLILNKSEVRE